jgi:hypothetical protein
MSNEKLELYAVHGKITDAIITVPNNVTIISHNLPSTLYGMYWLPYIALQRNAQKKYQFIPLLKIPVDSQFLMTFGVCVPGSKINEREFNFVDSCMNIKLGKFTRPDDTPFNQSPITTLDLDQTTYDISKNTIITGPIVFTIPTHIRRLSDIFTETALYPNIHFNIIIWACNTPPRPIGQTILHYVPYTYPLMLYDPVYNTSFRMSRVLSHDPNKYVLFTESENNQYVVATVNIDERPPTYNKDDWINATKSYSWGMMIYNNVLEINGIDCKTQAGQEKALSIIDNYYDQLVLMYNHCFPTVSVTLQMLQQLFVYGTHAAYFMFDATKVNLLFFMTMSQEFQNGQLEIIIYNVCKSVSTQLHDLFKMTMAWITYTHPVTNVPVYLYVDDNNPCRTQAMTAYTKTGFVPTFPTDRPNQTKMLWARSVLYNPIYHISIDEIFNNALRPYLNSNIYPIIMFMILESFLHQGILDMIAVEFYCEMTRYILSAESMPDTISHPNELPDNPAEFDTYLRDMPTFDLLTRNARYRTARRIRSKSYQRETLRVRSRRREQAERQASRRRRLRSQTRRRSR